MFDHRIRLAKRASPKSDKDKQRLLAWHEAQGKNATDEAMARGTRFHNAVEHFLVTGNEPIFNEDEQLRWDKALSDLLNIKNEFLCLETEVWSDKYEYAGRLDCLAWKDEELILIDWKTSARPKRHDWIEDYFIQGAAYALASYECGVAPKIPKEIRIYIFSPQRSQCFSRPLGFELVIAWLGRLKLFKTLSS